MTVLRPQRPACAGGKPQLLVETLECRALPGEALTGLLWTPAVFGPLFSCLAETRVAADDSASTIAVVDSGSVAHHLLGAAAEPQETGNLFAAAQVTDAPEESAGHAEIPYHEVLVAGATAGDDGVGINGLDAFVSSTPPAPPAPVSGLASADPGPAVGGRNQAPAGAAAPTGAAPAAPAPAAPMDGGGAVQGSSGTPAATPLIEVQGHGAAPLAGHNNGPTGLSPATIRQVYGFDQLTQTGAGQTIYIVDAYDHPNILSDVNTFSSQFAAAGLPQMRLASQPGTVPVFTKLTPQGTPQTNAGWDLEISLDVEWAHAIAPQANITLVEARSNSLSDLFGAINAAVNNGAHIVSMSWGAGDGAGEAANDSTFNQTGVAFFASSGDSGGVVTYPSSSPYVVSVGGTRLNFSGNTFVSESAWSSGGGGVSTGELQPAYQANYGLTYAGRATPDVSYDADPNSGVAVYDSLRYQGVVGWWQLGGTSAGAPQWAGLAALVDQSRVTPLSSTNLTSRFDYNAAASAVYGSNYRDITTGSNGHPATVGYDLATGLGSPLANNLVPYLINN
jgi:hypothetical protein